MRRRAPLPPHLHATSFASAETGFHHLSRFGLSDPALQRPFRGARALDLDLRSIRERCRAFEPLMTEGSAFSHTTALALHGVPLPASERDGLLHLSVPFPRTPPRRPGVRGHSIAPFPRVLVDGLPSVPVVLAWCLSARELPELQLVAAGDAIVTGRRERGRRRPPLATTDELVAAVDAWHGRPRAVRLRRVLPLIRSGVDSPKETELRLLLVAAGLPEPSVDHPVVIEDGTVRHADLAYPHARIAIEYEGDRHRIDRARWRGDIGRREAMEDAGWRVVRVTQLDLLDQQSRLIPRLRALLAARG